MKNKSLIYVPKDSSNIQKKINFQPVHDELTKAARMNPVQYDNSKMSIKFENDGITIDPLCNFPDEIAAMKANIPKNKIIDKHFHGGLDKQYLEVIFCKEGKIIVYFDSKNQDDFKEINKHNYCIIPPGEVHSIKSVEDSILICATIPADVNYPHF